MLLQTPRLWLAEVQAMRLATSTFVCSEPDRRYLARFVGAARVQTVPNSAKFPPPEDTDVSEPIVLFVGSMANRPNAHAADVLVQQIWPEVRARVPAARLVIVGSGAELTKSYPAQDPSVSFAGFVEDLGAWYRSARVVCCPIYHGSGTRVKIIEAGRTPRPSSLRGSAPRAWSLRRAARLCCATHRGRWLMPACSCCRAQTVPSTWGVRHRRARRSCTSTARSCSVWRAFFRPLALQPPEPATGSAIATATCAPGTEKSGERVRVR